MKISTGLAEIIQFPSKANRTAPEKTYVWPVYDAGKVTSINGIWERTSSDAIYSKPNPEDHKKLIQKMDNLIDIGYTPSGKTVGKYFFSYKPGTFFNALA
jgi:hypothetical protein